MTTATHPPPHIAARDRRRRRAAARATALLDAAYRASAAQDVRAAGEPPIPTRVRTSMVRWDDARAAFAFATADAVRWSSSLETFVTPPGEHEGDVLVVLGPGPLAAVQAARRILRDAQTGGAVARATRSHERGLDALAIIMPGLGTLLNAGTRLLP